MSGKRSILLLVALVSFWSPVSAHAESKHVPSIAFYYADQLPVDELGMFDQVVVEPTYVSAANLSELKKNNTRVIGYVSLGEARRDRDWFSDLDPQWMIGENKAWRSAILDLANVKWQDFVVDHLVAPLVQKGYSGLFLDTLDSYNLAIEDPLGRSLQRQGLTQLIHKLHQRFPALILLMNRGFDVVPEVQSMIGGVVAESLLQTWNPSTRVYGAVSDSDQQWLLGKLNTIHDQFHLPVYVIDYVTPSDRGLARETAKKISDLGFVPWVANPALDMLGISNIEIVPRRILVLYDSAESELPYSEAHRYLALPLQYMGYVADYANVREQLPAVTLTGKYAGIVSWFSDESMNSPGRFVQWLSRQLEDGVPLAILGSMGMQPGNEFFASLGLKPVSGELKKPLKIVYADEMAQMEAAQLPLSRGLFPLKAVDPAVQVHASIEDARHERMDVILTAPWGGMALAPYVLEKGLDEHARWRLNIFSFLEKSLRLEAMPVFDTTTENGSRLLMTHIDGDGAASRAVMPGSPLAIRVIRDEILLKYPLPATVSVITSEFEKDGLYPKLASEMQQVARSIFALPYVEIASHTYSHPFSWATAARDSHAHLNIPGYTYSLDKEINGSVSFINEELAPANKKVKVFLWSGDALPGEEALKMVDALGLRNLNGGNTIATSDNSSLTDISSMGRPVGGHVQVYAPVMNENLYTHNWTKPRYGFERVIETFKLSDTPRRLKPIDIYYHMYSGSEIASLNALRTVYDWSMQQETLPVWASEYSDKVDAYYHAVSARKLNGTWLMRASSALRTVRLDRRMGWPGLSSTSGLAGVRDIPQGRYVHFGDKSDEYGFYSMRLQKQPPEKAYLVRANAMIRHWLVQGKRIRMRLAGHMPVQFSLSQYCQLHIGKKTLDPTRQGDVYTFNLQTMDTGDALLVCR